MQLTGVLTLGLILTIGFLDIDVKGGITNYKLVRKTKVLTLSWLVSPISYILIQIAS